jgi:hypothetical protein
MLTLIAHTTRALAMLALCAAAIGCSQPQDDTPPVATPALTLSRSDAAVGSPVDVTYRFVVAPTAPALAEDYSVFVHFLDTDRELMWTDDHSPPTPVRQWKPGATIEYTRTMFVPKFPYVGETTVEVGLYSPRTGERLPLVGDDVGMRSYRVAQFRMSLQADNLFVIFKDGWHETEVADEGLEWQWSRKEGTIAFRNPKRDAILFLQLDQPVKGLAEPQRISVRVGATVVDTFTLPVGTRELRRVNLSASQLGADETVEMGIAVDRTFVPATMPEQKSSDHRELGIRVFRAYVEPK